MSGPETVKGFFSRSKIVFARVIFFLSWFCAHTYLSSLFVPVDVFIYIFIYFYISVPQLLIFVIIIIIIFIIIIATD